MDKNVETEEVVTQMLIDCGIFVLKETNNQEKDVYLSGRN